jgi:hypothetical protein
LWGNLDRGPNLVGFRSFISLDGSRKYGGKTRPILFDIWYPASEAHTATLSYERYLQVPDVPVHPWFRKRLQDFIRGVVIDDLFHKRESALNEDERSAFRKILATPTGAHLDALPLPGRFPVVLYHSGAGGSFEDNSVLFEYLAGHGYVVVSSAFESPFPRFVANNMGGVERSGPDLDFMAQKAREWSYADAGKLAAIGHSAGAQNILQWIGSPTCPARAVVSLDTTLEYPSGYEANKYLRAQLEKLTPPRIPVLLFAQARLNPQFTVFDTYLKSAPHYEAQAAELNHADFVTHGYVGRTLTHSENAEKVRQSYEEVCRTILAFLNASLQNDARAAASLQQSIPQSPVAVRYQTAR